MQNRSKLANIKIEPVKNLNEMMQIRKVRNDLRSYLTHDTKEISKLQQIIFYIKYLLTSRKKLTIYTVNFEGKIIGYGLIKADERNRRWLTGCLHEDFHGYGIGEKLFKHLIKQIDRKKYLPCLDVLATNSNAIYLYQKLGFIKYKQIDFVSYYYLPHHV